MNGFGRMRPALSYYGGKQRLAGKIVPLIPDHMLYAEPFAGGASVLFAKGRPSVSNKHDYIEVLNDTNGALVTFYRVASLRPDELAAEIEATPFALAEYERAAAILKGDVPADDLSVAWAVFVQLNMSFANKMFGGWRRAVVSNNSGTTWRNRTAGIGDVLKRLDGVQFDSIDAVDFIRLWDSEQTVFYVDPPYPGANQGHYGGYTQDDFERLVAALAEAKGSFVLSNYDNPAVPSHWRRVDLDAYSSARNGRDRHVDTRRTEVVWIVDRSGTVPERLKPKLWRPGKPPSPPVPSLWGGFSAWGEQ